MFAACAEKTAAVTGAGGAVGGLANGSPDKTVLQLRRGPTDRGSWQGRRERGVPIVDRRSASTRATEDAARGRETRSDSLPLDGARRLAGYVEQAPVDLPQL